MVVQVVDLVVRSVTSLEDEDEPASRCCCSKFSQNGGRSADKSMDQVFVTWSESPTVTSTDLVPTGEVDFPAITVCPAGKACISTILALPGFCWLNICFIILLTRIYSST